LITIGSISRETAAEEFPFLAKKYKGRRKAIKEFTHLSPDYVFWIYPNGNLFDAKDAHKKYQPKGYEHILEDEPDYCGFLRGRVASNFGPQIIVVYCRSDALESDSEKMNQFLEGVSQLPIPLRNEVIVISDNADIYGTINDIRNRVQKC
jgi:hypothetical protein